MRVAEKLNWKGLKYSRGGLFHKARKTRNLADSSEPITIRRSNDNKMGDPEHGNATVRYLTMVRMPQSCY
jgi:hypothetical protein